MVAGSIPAAPTKIIHRAHPRADPAIEPATMGGTGGAAPRLRTAAADVPPAKRGAAGSIPAAPTSTSPSLAPVRSSYRTTFRRSLRLPQREPPPSLRSGDYSRCERSGRCGQVSRSRTKGPGSRTFGRRSRSDRRGPVAGSIPAAPTSTSPSLAPVRSSYRTTFRRSLRLPQREPPPSLRSGDYSRCELSGPARWFNPPA